MPRNKAIDRLLNKSKTINETLAGEDAAALELARKAEDEGDDGPAIDPETGESVVVEEPEEPAVPPVKEEPAKEEPKPIAADADEAKPPVKADKEAPAPDANTLARANRLKRQNDALKKANEALQRRNAELANQPAPVVTAPEKKVEDDDPEPDKIQYPVEHGEWRDRQLDRKTRLLDEKLADLDQRVSQSTNQTRAQQMESQFDSVMDTFKGRYKAENTDFDDAYTYLQSKLMSGMRRDLVPEHEIPGRLKLMERTFCAEKANFARLNGIEDIGTYVMDQLMGAAEDRGWNPDAAESVVNDTKKPAPAAKTAQERLKDTAARTAAGRSVTALKPRAVELGDDEPMSAAKFMAMTPKQRAAYKKTNPQWESDMFEEQDSTPFFMQR